MPKPKRTLSGKPLDRREVCTPAAVTKYQDRNLVPVNPLKEQFEPTEAMPVQQKTRMAGGG